MNISDIRLLTMNELVKTPENKSFLKPSPKSPSRSCRKKSAAENKYVEGMTNLQFIKQDLHAIISGPKCVIFLVLTVLLYSAVQRVGCVTYLELVIVDCWSQEEPYQLQYRLDWGSIGTSPMYGIGLPPNKTQYLRLQLYDSDLHAMIAL